MIYRHRLPLPRLNMRGTFIHSLACHVVVLNCAQSYVYCAKNSTNSKNYVCNVKKKMIRIAGIKKSLLVNVARRICDVPLAILVKLVYLRCVMSSLPCVTRHTHTVHINHICKGHRFIFSTQHTGWLWGPPFLLCNGCCWCGKDPLPNSNAPNV